MYISYIVTGLLILLMIWGGKFSGFREFHEDHFALENTRSLRGLAALGVIIHHISQREFYQDAGELHSFVNAGFLFVAVFMFLSGFGLAKSLKNKPGYLKGFLAKRLPVIVVPFYVSVVICSIVLRLTGTKFVWPRLICNLIGITPANEYAWYPIVITILYIAFYLAFRKGKIRKGLIIIFVLVIVLGLVFCINGHRFWLNDPMFFIRSFYAPNYKWWAKERVFWFSGEWWVNANIAFFLGLLFAFCEEKINAFFRKKYFVKLPVLLVLYVGSYFLALYGQSRYGYWTEYSGNGPGVEDKIITFFMQMPQAALFVVLIYVVFMKYHFDNPVLRFFGKYSYETYMMNFLPVELLVVMQDKLSGVTLRAVYFITVFAITVVSALIYKAINKPLISFFTSKADDIKGRG